MGYKKSFEIVGVSLAALGAASEADAYFNEYNAIAELGLHLGAAWAACAALFFIWAAHTVGARADANL